MSTHFERVVEEARALQVMREDGKPHLYPRTIVDWARKNPTSALHGEFQWDDEVAADEFRLNQARQLIARIVIYIEQPKGEPVEYREWVSVPTNGERDGYTPTVDALKDPVERRRLIVRLLRGALGQTNNYPLPELAKWRQATERLIDQFSDEQD